MVLDTKNHRDSYDKNNKKYYQNSVFIIMSRNEAK